MTAFTSGGDFSGAELCVCALESQLGTGPAVATGLARWIMQLPSRHYTYRIAFTDAGQCIIASPPTDPPGPVVIVDGGPSCVGVECDAAVGE